MESDQKMIQQVEISSFDLRYESHRMRNHSVEKNLSASILEHGIRDPLHGVEPQEGCRILLDGFKRLRCARRLGMGLVPYNSIGNDEILGIIDIIRVSNQRTLSILEQAKLIDELRDTHKMSVGEIAMHLEKSKAWVSIRSGMIREMSEAMQQEIFAGKFPAYSYMYSIRPFMRINKIPKKDVEDFITSVSGQGVSTRDIDLLAKGYFKGSDDFRQQIKSGNLSWGLSRMQQSGVPSDNCTKLEQKMLRELDIVQKYMQRVIYQSKDTRLKGNAFFAQSNLLAGGILRNIETFKKELKEFHDRSRQAQSHISSL